MNFGLGVSGWSRRIAWISLESTICSSNRCLCHQGTMFSLYIYGEIAAERVLLSLCKWKYHILLLTRFLFMMWFCNNRKELQFHQKCISYFRMWWFLLNFQLCMKWGLGLQTFKKALLGQSKLSRVRDSVAPHLLWHQQVGLEEALTLPQKALRIWMECTFWNNFNFIHFIFSL